MRFIALERLAQGVAPTGDPLPSSIVKCVKCKVAVGLEAAKMGGWMLNVDSTALRAFYCPACVDVLKNGVPR